ncbi:M18 family aminopeptidase [Rathayibacter rathayi]|uniref:M18 family aminopeptidase n=1 Tax=Rathayibacter rathayi TaxID=33887 RepID=A0ABD6W997_RATRA|nr:M18 family aminopeptidase [Rathayibacter rathayi]AZZ50144.1 M18 family aminopeptidase [Rathayibacter rathayi]MWV74572.1 M18 family aminopeptidase [Rathayibacter rathayi NCPPB 2980 = VKM Ac-1601]PPF14585.1 M18 family aminopeptidase [Rathayibacter rathayi]PPF49708.1 M18 family aminopeptidase [Rathayibacter rathayi]PPF75468.1 M18 family aminopeptidase [Rathayibacter rathayi]
MTTREHHIADFAEFLTASPSSYHAVAEVARRLDVAGFTGLDETRAWPTGPGRYYVIRDGAIIAWHLPEGAEAVTPFRILGAHTDSPGFMLKPRPTIGSKGWLQAGVEIYGGPLLTSWLDRELELAGRVILRDGSTRLLRTGPFLRIPQLAIHLDRTANDSLILDRQKHTVPVFGIGDAAEVDLLELLAAYAGLDSAAEIAGYDLLTADTQAPRRFGLDEMFLAAGRMDDLSSVHAGLVALLAANDDAGAGAGHISVLAAFDHEELGSASRSGANGPFLKDVLSRIGTALGAGVDERARAIAGSWCLSADAGHSVHPNYSDKHDPVNQPVAGKGPLLKINATQRYATDARGAALWAEVCERAGVEYQEFVSNNSVPCGSTIGPLTATRIGISTVDVGVPLLSMHSARELAHVDDLVTLNAAIEAFFRP